LGKILDLLFLLVSHTIIIFIKFLRFRETKPTKEVAAFPYYANGWPGGYERIGNWKPYFESEGNTFDIYWCSTKKEFEDFLRTKSIIRKYRFHFKVLFRRIKTLKKLSQYSTIWIQRSFIPYFPYKDSLFEKKLNKLNKNIIIDFYDADYTSNYNLIINAAKSANKVSVATPFLKEFFERVNPNTFHLRMTIDQIKYIEKKHINNSEDKIIIGWMGNPGNALNLKKLETVLQKIETNYNDIEFHFLCSDLPMLNIKNLKSFSWDQKNFDYYEWISKIDIGISPYFGDSDRLKAKPAMKTLEFMASNIAVVSSIWGSFDKMKDKQDILIADSDQDWYDYLSKLILEKDFRIKIAKNGNKKGKKFHSYEKQFPQLKKIFEL